jgi:hypothetical protein
MKAIQGHFMHKNKWMCTLQSLGGLALVLSLVACASVQELLGTSDVPPGWNPNAPLAVAPIKPLTPVVNHSPFTTHLLDTSLPNSAAPLPLAPPMPSGTVLYPWRVVPGAPVPAVALVAAPAMAPQPVPPAPLPPVPSASLVQPAVCAPTPACPAAAPVKKASARSYVYRVQKPRPKRTVTRQATVQRRAMSTRIAAPRAARNTRRTAVIRNPSQRRNPNVPLDCTNLWRTNPYLADKLHCRPLTLNAPNAPAPSANGAN